MKNNFSMASRILNFNKKNEPKTPVYYPPDENICGTFKTLNKIFSMDINIDANGHVTINYTKNGSSTTQMKGQLNIDIHSFVVFDNTFFKDNIGTYVGTYTSSTTILFQSVNAYAKLSTGITFFKSSSASSPTNPRIFLNGTPKVTNTLNVSRRHMPYIELIYISSDGNNIIYTNNSFQGMNTPSADNLILDVSNNKIILNDRRFAVYDSNVKININIEPTDEFPDIKYLSFKTNNDSKLYIKFELTNITTAGSQAYYSEAVTQRQNKWVYYPYTMIYYLVNLNDITNIKIYVMQTYCCRIKSDLNANNLCYIKDYIKDTLPTGWIFSYMLLGSENYLTINCYGEAIVLNDSLINTYEYVYPSTAPFLYNMVNSQINAK